MNTFEKRLATFDHENWNGVVSKEALAKSGFYYLNYGDLVECFVCSVQIFKWEVDDDVESEHARHRPSCLFLKDKSLTGPPRSEPCCSFPSIRTNGNDKALCLYKSRWETFKNWPTTAYFSAEELAALGFFYCGIGDTVSCFNCQYILTDSKRGNHTAFELHRNSFMCRFMRKFMAFPLCDCGKDMVNAFLKCGHFSCCYTCASINEKCKICDCVIEEYSKVFFNLDYDLD